MTILQNPYNKAVLEDYINVYIYNTPELSTSTDLLAVYQDEIKSTLRRVWPKADPEDYTYELEWVTSHMRDIKCLRLKIIMLPEVRCTLDRAYLEYIRDYQQQVYP